MKRAVTLAACLSALVLAGCGARLDEIGVAPSLSPVGTGIQPAALSSHHYPNKPAKPVARSSLWDDRQSRMYTDARAIAVGDILTVEITMNDKAKFENESERSRDVGRTLDLAGSFSFDGSGSSGSAGGDIGSGTSTTGAGSTERSEAITLRVAAVVTDVMANGNLRISGSQEVRVNAELRELTVAGIVRPRDIGPANTISHERIAEARISYGGRGRLSEVQQPPYGQQFLDAVLPF